MRYKYELGIPSTPKIKFPLSYQQERLLVLCSRYTESSYWNRVYGKRLKGKLDLNKLADSLKELVDIHELLKVRIVYENDEPYQYIQSTEDYIKDLIEYVDYSSMPVFEAERTASELYENECLMPVDVVNKNLFKVIIIKQNKEDYILIMKFHHIITDAASIRLFWADLKDIYNNGKIKRKLEDSLSFQDFVFWQRKEFAIENMSAHDEYWMSKFNDEIPVLSLPEDYHKKNNNYLNGSIVKEIVSEEFLVKLNKFNLRNRFTLNSTLLTVFYILLHKYSHQNNIVIGTVFSGRQYDLKLNHTFGFFINTIAFPFEINAELSINEMILEVQNSIKEMYHMQDYPLQELVQSICRRKGHIDTLFDVMFNLVTEYSEEKFADMEEEPLEMKLNSVQTNLLLDITNRNNKQLVIKFEYNTDIFCEETVKELLTNYINLLLTIIDSGNEQVSMVSFPESEELTRFLYEYNNTDIDLGKERLLHQLFEEQVIKSPDKDAAIFGENHITFEELNYKANHLAHLLREKGVCRNHLVGISLPRSVEMLIAILGILKAGGAYLPLDPEYPSSRIVYILHDAGVNILLTDTICPEPEEFMGEIVKLNQISVPDSGATIQNLDYVNNVQDLAYTIYTSGSTGKPKGVMISHRSAQNTICDINRRFSISENDNIIALSSVTFDLSVYDIFGCFSTGASLIGINSIRKVDEIANLIKKNKVTVWNSVPAIMEMFLSGTENTAPNPEMSLVMLSGDWIPLYLPDKIKERFPNANIISLGGATEASVWSIFYPIGDLDPCWTSIPYGMPLWNQKIYILDDHLNSCPFGVTGDIYIGGVGIAKGYLNDEEKTKAAFIWHKEYGYIYRTGDLGKLSRKGYVTFLGRKDLQVKIRGHRIELEEIDKALLACPGIKESITIVREDSSGNPYLAAYITAEHEEELDTDRIYNSLQKWLVPYMIPSTIIQLAEIPITENGKVNRKSFPEPSQMNVNKEVKRPRNQVEEVICEIWEESLGMDNISILDNFFMIGGHSLIATKVITKINSTFKKNYNLNMMWELTTIAEWGEEICNFTKAVYLNSLLNVNSPDREEGIL